jgi:hypothetical protein
MSSGATFPMLVVPSSLAGVICGRHGRVGHENDRDTVLSGTLGLLGCGSSDDGSGGSAGSGGSGGTGGSGGAGGTGGTDAAAAFCDGFEATCNYIDYQFENRADCIDFYNTEDAARVTCVEQHLGFAMDAEPDSADRDLHCGHASGLPPCS